ncbi:hypothetical protein CsSME_00053084 [Camellia sinensis var. sinensis]
MKKRQVRFQLPLNPGMAPLVREELLDLIQVKEAGVAYIIGHFHVKARRSSSFLNKLNYRGLVVALNIPYISLIEVGMTYYFLRVTWAFKLKTTVEEWGGFQDAFLQ